MKRLFFGIVAILMVLICCAMTLSPTNDYNIKTVVGKYKVLDNGADASHQTIVGTITGYESDSKQYLLVKNSFDSKDIVSIPTGHYKKGEVVLVTFKHDDVAKVELNHYNIGNKVFGQNIK